MLKMECGKYSDQFGLHETQANDGPEKHDLPVEQAGPRQIASNDANDALIDERRERPDVVLVDGHGAQLAGEKTAKHIERHRRPLAMQQRRDAHQHAAQRSRPASADHAQQQRGFETQVARQENSSARSESRRQS